MGCGASSATNSPEVVQRSPSVKETPDAARIREVHEAIGDNNALQKVIFPAPRSIQTKLNKDYGAQYGSDLMADPFLIEDFVWGMVTSENLPKYQMDYFIELGYMIDVRQVLDIIATLQPPTTIADIFNDEAVTFVKKHFGAEQEIIDLVAGRSQLKDSYEVAYGEVNLVHKARYFAKRIKDLMSSFDNIPQVLYIVIMRCEVDLCDIASEFESLTSVCLWSKLQSCYTHIKLLDHSTPSQVATQGSNVNTSIPAKEVVSEAKTSTNVKKTIYGIEEKETTDSHEAEDNFKTADEKLISDEKICDEKISDEHIVCDYVIAHNNTTPDNTTADNAVLQESLSTGGSRTQVSIKDSLGTLHLLLSEEFLRTEELCDVLVDIAQARDPDVVKMYSNIYQEDLLKSLKEKMPLDAYSAAQYVLAGYAKASATLLDKAIQDNDNTTIDLILMVLLCSSTQQLNDINKAFNSLTHKKRNLSDVLAMNLLGEFQRFVTALLKGNRDETASVEDGLAILDAKSLSKVTDFTWTGDDNVFNEVFIKRGLDQLKLTFQHFHDESGSDITELILQEFSFHLQKALLNIVYIANNKLVKFLAKFLFEAKWKSHFNSVLIWTIAARYHVDLEGVSHEYNVKYNASVALVVESSTLSPECRTLLSGLSQSTIAPS